MNDDRISKKKKLKKEEKRGCSLIRACSLIRSNTVDLYIKLRRLCDCFCTLSFVVRFL